MDQSYFNHRLLILLVISIALYSLNIFGELILFLCILASALLASSIHIADQWDRAVVLRMGKYQGLKGPGPFYDYSDYRFCIDLY